MDFDKLKIGRIPYLGGLVVTQLQPIIGPV